MERQCTWNYRLENPNDMFDKLTAKNDQATKKNDEESLLTKH